MFKGIVGSAVSFIVIAIVVVALYRANNGDVVGGALRLIDATWNFISAGADKLVSFSWFKEAVTV